MGKMKIQEIARRADALGMIPLAKVNAAVRVKAVRAMVEYEKATAEYRKALDEALKKLKPEGFDERLEKYRAAIYPTDADRAEAERQAAEEGFADFKAEHDRILAEWREVDAKMSAENEYDVAPLPAFTDADFERIAEALPCGGTVSVDRAAGTADVPNDEVLRYIIAALA